MVAKKKCQILFKKFVKVTQRTQGIRKVYTGQKTWGIGHKIKVMEHGTAGFI